VPSDRILQADASLRRAAIAAQMLISGLHLAHADPAAFGTDEVPAELLQRVSSVATALEGAVCDVLDRAGPGLAAETRDRLDMSRWRNE
jgi:hypothetical protein